MRGETLFSFFKKKATRTERGPVEISVSILMGSDEQLNKTPPELNALVLALYAGFKSVDGQAKIKGFERRFASANRDILASQYSAYLINRSLAAIAPRYILAEYGEEPEVADLIEGSWRFFPTFIELIRERFAENKVRAKFKDDPVLYLDGFEPWYERVRQEYYNEGLTNRDKHHFDPAAALATNISAAISAKSFRDVAEPPEFQRVSERGLLDGISNLTDAAIFGVEIIPEYLKSLRTLRELSSS